MLPADGFIAETLLEQWVRGGVAARTGHTLSTRSGLDLVLVDALRVLGRRDGESDPYGLTGRILSLRELVDRGASLHNAGMRLGSAVYDVELGYRAEVVAPAA